MSRSQGPAREGLGSPGATKCFTRCSNRFEGLRSELVLGVEVPVASILRSRLLGLAFLDRGLAPPGLLFPGCRSIHTFGMRFSLDVVFLDEAGDPIRIIEALAPRRFASDRRAEAVLELQGGTFRLAGVDGALTVMTTEGEGANDV